LVPVCDGKRLVGVVTDRDIVVRAVADNKAADACTVQEAMSGELRYCSEDQTIEDAARLMGEWQARRLPVLDGDRQLVGIISIGDSPSWRRRVRHPKDHEPHRAAGRRKRGRSRALSQKALTSAVERR
jgi:CBS-domain-containing membrane protein